MTWSQWSVHSVTNTKYWVELHSCIMLGFGMIRWIDRRLSLKSLNLNFSSAYRYVTVTKIIWNENVIFRKTSHKKGKERFFNTRSSNSLRSTVVPYNANKSCKRIEWKFNSVWSDLSDRQSYKRISCYQIGRLRGGLWRSHLRDLWKVWRVKEASEKCQLKPRTDTMNSIPANFLSCFLYL